MSNDWQNRFSYGDNLETGATPIFPASNDYTRVSQTGDLPKELGASHRQGVGQAQIRNHQQELLFCLTSLHIYFS